MGLIVKRKGIEIVMPTSGGKAGKGCNKTSSLQVRKDNMIVKQFRFTVNDPVSRKKAMDKARELFIALVGQD